MDRFITRATVTIVALYFIISFLLAQFAGIDVFRYSYVLLFELCTVAYTFCSGKYHCRYIRWTALAVLLSDTITHADYYFNFLSVDAFNLIPIAILSSGIITSLYLSIKHFIRVHKVRSRQNG